MNKEQLAIKQWMTKAGQSCPNSPQIPSLEIRKLRARLILEEAFELINKGLGLEVQTFPDEYIDSRDIYFEGSAEYEPDLIELADGIADLQVVNLGTAVACGIDIEPLDGDMELVAGQSITPLPEGEYLVKDKGGKVVKPPSYSPANIKPILEGQTRGVVEKAI